MRIENGDATMISLNEYTQQIYEYIRKEPKYFPDKVKNILEKYSYDEINSF